VGCSDHHEARRQHIRLLARYSIKPIFPHSLRKQAVTGCRHVCPGSNAKAADARPNTRFHGPVIFKRRALSPIIIGL
jgi:hypothetical protein